MKAQFIIEGEGWNREAVIADRAPAVVVEELDPAAAPPTVSGPSSQRWVDCRVSTCLVKSQLINSCVSPHHGHGPALPGLMQFALISSLEAVPLDVDRGLCLIC